LVEANWNAIAAVKSAPFRNHRAGERELRRIETDEDAAHEAVGPVRVRAEVAAAVVASASLTDACIYSLEWLTRGFSATDLPVFPNCELRASAIASLFSPEGAVPKFGHAAPLACCYVAH